MLNQLKPDIRKLLELTRKMENYDATLAAYQAAGKPIQPKPAGEAERKRMGLEAIHLRSKWGI